MKALIAALLTGLLLSLGLFWLMQTMLMGNQQALKKSENLNRMQFVRLIRKPPEKPKPKKPPEKKVEKVQEVQAGNPEPKKQRSAPKKQAPKVEKVAVVKHAAPVDIPDLDVPRFDLPVQATKSSGAAVSMSGSVAGQGNAKGTGNGGSAGKGAHGAGGSGKSGGVSSGVIPLSRVPPKYPLRAANRHIEGWVKIEFTITTLGTVIDPVVVDAQPADIFDEAAVTAISQWKFKEKKVDGVAVTQRAVQTLQFKIIH